MAELTEIEIVAKDRADRLLDAIAAATQDCRFLRGDPEYDAVAGEAILLNAEKAIKVALDAYSKAALPADVRRLVEKLRRMSPQLDMIQCEDVLQAADTLEALAADNASLRATLAPDEHNAAITLRAELAQAGVELAEAQKALRDADNAVWDEHYWQAQDRWRNKHSAVLAKAEARVRGKRV